MKSMEQLEKAYQREVELTEKHKKNAADIKKQMELQQGKAITQKVNAMNMNSAEYDQFMKLLAGGKRTVLEAAELALSDARADHREGGEEKNETSERS